MNRFVRPSKYRHVYGTAAKRDYCYDNVRVSLNAWDTNMVQVNPVSAHCLCHGCSSGLLTCMFSFSYL